MHGNILGISHLSLLCFPNPPHALVMLGGTTVIPCGTQGGAGAWHLLTQPPKGRFRKQTLCSPHTLGIWNPSSSTPAPRGHPTEAGLGCWYLISC